MKKVLITGGTGSFGQTMVKHLLEETDYAVTIYSRDEFKQYEMKNKFLTFNSRLEFLIGDVRDKQRTKEAMRNIDLVFHAAALKQVPACEVNPFEAVKTNVLGAKNVVEAAIEMGVPKVVAISTDKAVKPVNVMGMSKALQEKIMLEANGHGHTDFSVVRYGNIAGSRGSVVPLFSNAVQNNQPMPITQGSMTRFWLTLQDAIQLVLFAAENQGGLIYVKKSPACKLINLANAIAITWNKPNAPIKLVGLRKGEKVHEVLVAENEMVTAQEKDGYYLIDPDLPMPVGVQGNEYSSDTTELLSVENLVGMLARL